MKQSFYFLKLLVNSGFLLCSFAATAQVSVQWDKTLGYRKGIYYLKVVDSEGAHLKRVVVE